MKPRNDPSHKSVDHPDETNHSALEEDVKNEEMPVSNPRRAKPHESEEYPGKDDEPEPIPPPDQARG